MATEDDAGNIYGFDNKLIKPWVPEPQQSWGDAALDVGTAPARLATGVASSLSPYGAEDGWQVPPIIAEPARALNRLSEHGGFPNPSDPQNKQDMSALVMSMFGGNAFAPARAGEAVAARALSDTGKPSLIGSALAGAENHLPMDLESRMARAKEMGMRDEDVYHGTASDFDAFNLDRAGSVSGSRAGREGVSVSPTTDVANAFAERAAQPSLEGGRVLPLRYRSDRQGSLSLQGDELDHEVSATLAHAWGQGFDSVRLKNYSTPDGKKSDVIVVKNPNQLRSRNAVFDPSRKDENGLLLSDTGKPSALGAAMAGANQNQHGVKF